jgi:recombination protein RecR
VSAEFKIPPALEDLTNLLSKFPGVGKKSAFRMALAILNESRENALALARAIVKIKDEIKPCSICGNISQSDPCYICADPKRDHSLICVVEQSADILSIEKGGVYRGGYQVLGGVISPLEGIAPDKLNLNKLSERVKSGAIREVIIATNPTTEGDATGLYIVEMLKGSEVKVTRIARGIPVGGDLEYTDPATIAKAMEGRGEI